MEKPQNEHLQLDSSSDPDENGIHQIHEGKIIDVFERISDAFYTVDYAWRFTYINRHAEELWGRSRQELLRKNIWKEFPHACDSEYHQQLNRAVEQGVTTKIEMVCPISGACIIGRAYPHRWVR